VHAASPDAILYLPATHCVHTSPPFGPDQPALHVQAVAMELPNGEFELAGQSTQVLIFVAPGVTEYVAVLHSTHSLFSLLQYAPGLHSGVSYEKEILIVCTRSCPSMDKTTGNFSVGSEYPWAGLQLKLESLIHCVFTHAVTPRRIVPLNDTNPKFEPNTIKVDGDERRATLLLIIALISGG